MPSEYETFFEKQCYVVVGHEAKRPFPRLTFGGLRRKGKAVFAVDPTLAEVDGQRTYSDLAALPEVPEAAVLELPREETAGWVERLADAGVRDIWLHMNTESEEALALGRARGLNLRTGTCAVQYVDDSFPHSVHKFARRALGRW